MGQAGASHRSGRSITCHLPGVVGGLERLVLRRRQHKHLCMPYMCVREIHAYTRLHRYMCVREIHAYMFTQIHV